MDAESTNVFINLSGSYQAIYYLIIVAAALTALVIFTRVMMGLVALADKPPGSHRFGYGHIVAGLFAVGLLANFIATISMGSVSIYGLEGQSIKEYYTRADPPGDSMGARTVASLRSLAGMLQLLGFLAVLRSGIMLWNVGQDQRATGWGVGMFFLSGIMLINIEATLKLVLSTGFGVDFITPWIEALES